MTNHLNDQVRKTIDYIKDNDDLTKHLQMTGFMSREAIVWLLVKLQDHTSPQAIEWKKFCLVKESEMI